MVPRNFAPRSETVSDGNRPGQFRSLDLAIAANQAGLTLAYLPVLSGRVARDGAREFGALLNQLPTPVLADCRSSLRSATLWALSQADRQAWPKLVPRAPQAGFNLGGVMPPTQTSHLRRLHLADILTT